MKQLYGILFHDAEPKAWPPSLYGIAHGRLTAVVGEADVESYRHIPPAELVHYLETYQERLRPLCEQTAVLPAQFGSLLHNDDQVRYVLHTYGDEFERMLTQLTEMVQLELSLTWDARAILTEIANSLHVESVKQEVEKRPPDEIRAAQESLRRQVQITFVQRQAELEQVVRQQMAPLCRAIVKLPQTDDNTAVHLALILPRSEQPRAEQLLAALRQRIQMKCHLEWHGPLYPRDLASVVVRVPNLALVTHARELLGLGESATLEEIRTAYYAHKYYIQPSQHSGLDSIVNMLELAQAYKLLKELAENQGGHVCRMDATAVQQTIAVNLLYPQEV